MGWESFGLVKFDLGPLVQGQTRIAKLKSAYNSLIIVSTGSIQWILWLSVRYAGAAARREIFGVNTLRGKLHQLGSPNLQDIFTGWVSFSEKEISLILKNKMAAAGISLKIIYIFLLQNSVWLAVVEGALIVPILNMNKI